MTSIQPLWTILSRFKVSGLQISKQQKYSNKRRATCSGEIKKSLGAYKESHFNKHNNSQNILQGQWAVLFSITRTVWALRSWADDQTVEYWLYVADDILVQWDLELKNNILKQAQFVQCVTSSRVTIQNLSRPLMYLGKLLKMALHLPLPSPH